MKGIRTVALVIALAAPSMAIAQAAPTAKPSAEITKLAGLLVGSWSYEGALKPGPFSPPGKVTGTESYETGPGGFSLVHRYDEKNPLGAMKGIEIYSYDVAKKAYATAYFNGTGESGTGSGTWTGNTLSWSGSAMTYEGKPGWWRCAWTLAGQTAITVKCDGSSDGKTWTTGTFEGKWTKK